MKNELKQLVALFLSSNKISFNKEELHLQLLSHPYFPSINAITDLFDHFKIENVAAELPQKASIISELPENFLAHIKEDNSENIVLVEKKSNELKLIYNTKTTKIMSYKEFVDSWTGVVVAIEKDEQNSKEYSKNHSILKPFAIGILALLVIGTLILFPLKIISYGYLLTALLGL